MKTSGDGNAEVDPEGFIEGEGLRG